MGKAYFVLYIIKNNTLNHLISNIFTLFDKYRLLISISETDKICSILIIKFVRSMLT